MSLGEAAALLAADGPLARKLEHFRPRAAQQAMAEAVAAAMAAGEALLVEAATGTGKTYAYLLPALVSGQRVVISTGTRALQDQLFEQDLPRLRAALGLPGSVVRLKGRANYLCLERLGEGLAQAGAFPAPMLLEIAAWAEQTREGDLAELPALGSEDPLRAQVSSTTENCLGTQCPRLGECFVARARREAQAADVVIVNHHLLFADLALRQDGFAEILPHADAIIVDEAHQVPEAAAGFFGSRLSGRMLRLLAQDVQAALGRAPEVATPELWQAARALEAAPDGLRHALPGGSGRLPWAACAAEPGFGPRLEALQGRLAALAAALAAPAEQSYAMDHLRRRALALDAELAVLAAAPGDSAAAVGAGAAPRDLPGPAAADPAEAAALAGEGAGRTEPPAPDAADADSPAEVAWAEFTPRGFILRRTPVDIAPALAAYIYGRRCAWIFTSATLTVDGSFTHMQRRLGLEAPRTLRLDSPFDFAGQTLLYLPPGLPAPSDPGHTAAAVAAARPVIEACGGRAFFLFTSHRALGIAAALLRATLDYPLLVQGEAPPARLLASFRRYGNAVLLGTGGFWAGVDVPGPALQLVIIDKLPFAAPGDPVLAARLAAARAAGEDPFTTLQVPAAALTLKQGAGRLLRREDDRGVLMITDPRLVRRGYGRTFLRSLPPMPLTEELAQVQAFFAGLRASEPDPEST